MAGKAEPLAGFTHPGLCHGHREGLGLTCADVDSIGDDAPQDGSVAHDADVGLAQRLAVPPVRASPIRVEVRLQIEPFVLVRHPAELGMQQRAKAALILARRRADASARRIAAARTSSASATEGIQARPAAGRNGARAHRPSGASLRSRRAAPSHHQPRSDVRRRTPAGRQAARRHRRRAHGRGTRSPRCGSRGPGTPRPAGWPRRRRPEAGRSAPAGPRSPTG